MLKLEEDIQTYSELLKAVFNIKLGNDVSSLNNSLGFKLEKDKITVWVNEPSPQIIDGDFKTKLEKIITVTLFPKWVLKHEAGLNLIELKNRPAESARALLFKLHYGLYERLVVNSVTQDTFLYENKNHNLKIELMKNYFFNASATPHLGIMAQTRSGKTSFLIYLLGQIKNYGLQQLKEGARSDTSTVIRVVDPKKDPNLMRMTKEVNGKYLAPDFESSENKFIIDVCDCLKEVISIMRSRADELEQNPTIKYEDVWLIIDEGLAIVSSTNTKTRNLYFSLLDKILLMGASVKIHVIFSTQSFISGSTGVMSSASRLQLGTRILLASKITSENAQFLFKDLDSEQLKNLVIDTDNFGNLGIGLCTNGDAVVPFKAPYISELANNERNSTNL